MGYVTAQRITLGQLDRCDSCNNEGLKETGKYITNSQGETVIFFCYNCKKNLTA